PATTRSPVWGKWASAAISLSFRDFSKPRHGIRVRIACSEPGKSGSRQTPGGETSAMVLDAVEGSMQSVGHYDLLEKSAEDGVGAIYKGRKRHSGEIVAIKIMPPHMAANPVLLKRFEQEFRAASKLDHPNIVRALDYGESGTSPFLVMEYVEGESL